jgi:hypothetical protein
VFSSSIIITLLAPVSGGGVGWGEEWRGIGREDMRRDTEREMGLGDGQVRKRGRGRVIEEGEGLKSGRKRR